VPNGHANDPVMPEYGKYLFSRALGKPYCMQEIKVAFSVVIAGGVA
jgi:hypothetical protein